MAKQLLGPEDPYRKALREHLQALEEADVLKLQTLMYAGREHEDPRDLHLDLLARTVDRLDAESTMVSKFPLAHYLRTGLGLAKKLGVDLDAPWGRGTKRGTTAPVDAPILSDGDFHMKTTPVRVAVKSQLMIDRDEVVAAREMVRTGGEPPHGFDAKVRSSLNAIADQRLPCSAKAQSFSDQIATKQQAKWDLHDIDSIITLIDSARAELEASST